MSFSDLDGHPYSSPETHSVTDNVTDELNFDEFDMNHMSDSESSDIVVDNFGSDDDVPQWCECGNCTTCSDQEAICCNHRPEIIDILRHIGDCVIDEDFFKNNLLCEQGLEFSRYTMASMIKKKSDRDEYLNKPFTNRLKRNLAYINFLVFLNKGYTIGRYNRVVIPSCVVLKIRQTFPESDGLYTGFKDVQSEILNSISEKE